METIYVQFSDSTETTIISSFGAPQDATIWPNQGTVESSDPRWATFYKLIDASSQQGLPVPSGD